MKNIKLDITLPKIKKAKMAISPHILPTPMLRNSILSDIYGCDVFLKLENMTPIGSFKIRGATNKLMSLDKKDRKRGVVAASQGNHAQGVAWAAKLLDIDSLIIMPRDAPLVKIHNTEALGAKVILHGESFDEVTSKCSIIANETGRIRIPAYEDGDIICGQATIGLEILESLPDVDYIIGAMGGGGMMTGVSVAAKEISNKVKVIGCQAEGASALAQAILGHSPMDSQVKTFADGVCVPHVSEAISNILASRLDSVYCEDDEAIAKAVLMLLEGSKIVSEGAGAIPLAVLDRIHKDLRGKRVVLIISGGNIDVNLLARIIDLGLIRAGRRIRVNVVLIDRPGSFSELTSCIAGEGANIIQAIHDRNEPGTVIDEAAVALTLETRGHSHSKKVLSAIKKHSVRIEELC